MQVTAYRAGHVLGACMFEVEIAGMRLLYTGDYSRVPDRHLSAADTPDNPPHIGEVCQTCHMYWRLVTTAFSGVIHLRSTKQDAAVGAHRPLLQQDS